MIHMSKRSATLIGGLIFCIPLAVYILWIHACNQTNGYPENVKLFTSYFPEFLRGRFTVTVLSLVLCILAVTLNVRNLKSSNKFLRVMSWVIVIAGGLLGFLYLFSMM
jgi:glycerol uptake facilitator-like aquaporin